MKLPDELRPAFWDIDFDSLSWPDHADFVTGRILSSGDWNSIGWLRQTAGDVAIADWLQRKHGGGLSAPKIRFWEIVLRLSRRTVNSWLKADSRQAWENRHVENRWVA